MKKKKKGKKNLENKGDRLEIKGEHDDLFEGIDMNDGDESSAIPIWHSQVMAPKKCIAKRHEPPRRFKIDYVYGGKMNDVRLSLL